MKLLEGWQRALMAEMDRRFEIYRTNKRHDESLCIDDTQIGVEFAIDFIKQQLAAAPTPPAQEAEPVYQVRLKGNTGWSYTLRQGYDSYSAYSEYERRTLYTHAPSDKLRQAAEELVEHFTSVQLPPDCTAFVRVENLRAALEGKS